MENDNSPATKGDVKTTENRLEIRIKETEDRLVETMRDIQTEMLKAFYNFAEGNNKRLAQTEVTRSPSAAAWIPSNAA